MKIFVKWVVATLVIFLLLCTVSYHNSLNNDGSLSFGFPKEIYHKSVMVMLAATGEIGEAEHFYTLHLLTDILFAAVIATILFIAYQRWNKRRKK